MLLPVDVGKGCGGCSIAVSCNFVIFVLWVWPCVYFSAQASTS